ncbi:MAG: hypothetical protein JWM99_1663 [Verrucomicrobiales bacterium]|nr:hypothetical protein [Verrucomicrobiales bacterium]
MQKDEWLLPGLTARISSSELLRLFETRWRADEIHSMGVE